MKILQEGTGKDKLTAIFSIGHSELPQAADILAPFLASSDLLDRWAAACCLGFRRDERALPILEEYLLAEVPTVEVYVPRFGKKIQRIQPEAEIWFNTYRGFIPWILATWGPSSLVSTLRQAFLHIWEQEKKNEPGPTAFAMHDAVCYALGRRGAMAALHGIELPAYRRRIAMIYLALGHLRADEHFTDLGSEMITNKILKQEVTEVLAEYFALSESECQEAIASWWNDRHKRRNWFTQVK